MELTLAQLELILDVLKNSDPKSKGGLAYARHVEAQNLIQQAVKAAQAKP